MFLVFISCDKDGTIVHNPPYIHESTIDSDDYSLPSQENNLNGCPNSSENLCYALEDVYFDFSSTNATSYNYHKFNYANIAENSPHDEDDDVLSLTAYQKTYLMAVPSTSIIDNSDNQVLVVDDMDQESYNFTTQSIVDQVADPAYCIDGNQDGDCDDVIKYIDGEISLSSVQLQNVEEIRWNPSQGRYDVDPIPSDVFSQAYLYSQPYEEINLKSVIDPELYDVYGDLVLVDSEEIVSRNYDIYKLLEDESEVYSYREATYSTQYTYLDQIDALISRVNTDCNDNYQLDSENEIVIFDGYYDSPSFEKWCIDEGGNFNFDSISLCNTMCEFDDESLSINMENFCWEYYHPKSNNLHDFNEDNRLTGDCFQSTNPNTKIQYLSGDLNSYQLTFCDRGNNLYDVQEFFLDQYDDNEHGENENQGVEPFEDRNCNNRHDSNEVIPNDVVDGWSAECLSYVSTVGSTDFCDQGNRIWDRAEELNSVCLNDGFTGTQGSYSDYKDYQCLFELGDRDDRLIVDYSNQYTDDDGDGIPDDNDGDGLADGPIALTSILPRASFFDTGEDGCYDIFEDGEGGCLCEIDNCLGSYTPSCEEYLVNLGLMDDEDKDSGGYYLGDVNKDGKITDIDIALAVSQNMDYSDSPYDYGTCINGYSGSKKDCCEHEGCLWMDDECSEGEGACNIDLSDSEWWTQNLDPNGDNYNETSNDSGTEFNGQFDNDTKFGSSGKELTKEFINESLSTLSNNYKITYEEFCSGEYNQGNYAPNYYEAPTVTTKYLDYNDDNDKGADVLQIIKHEQYTKDYNTKMAIIGSKNTLRSHPIIDQLDFNDNQNTSSCYDYLSSSSCNGNISWCTWNSTSQTCEVDSELLYTSMINDYYLVKTEFINLDGEDDYDYMVFDKANNDIIKMIHPYYHYGQSSQIPNDFQDFSSDDFWQGTNLVPDTLIYSSDGNISEGQYFHSLDTIYTAEATYFVAKEYTVSATTAELTYAEDDPKCKVFNASECGNTDEFWCDWDADNEVCYTAIKQKNIKDCLLVSRVIETTAKGSDYSFQLKSDTYLKPYYGIVKEDLLINWDKYPWLANLQFSPISSIEYMTPSEGSSSLSIGSQGNIFQSYEAINPNETENLEEFNYKPFKITNTMGVQRIELPINE